MDLLAFARHNQLFFIGAFLTVANLVLAMVRLRWGGRYCDRCGASRKASVIAICGLGALLGWPSIAAADVTVTFWTTPAGATIVDTGRPWGESPVVLTYKTPRRWRHCLQADVTALWVSGAESSRTTVPICPDGGKQQAIKIERPTGAPGLELDVQYGAQSQQLAILRQQLAVQQSLANDVAWSTAYAAVTASLAQVRTRPHIACLSLPDVAGISVWTTCR